MQDVGNAAHLAARFASALAADGTPAMYLRSNARDGWATVEEAAASGRPFCISVRDDVLVLDADLPVDPDAMATSRCHHSLLSLQGDAQREGISAWLVESGGPGRRHLYLIGIDRHQHARYSDRAKERGLDPRAGNNRIRPPFSPSAKYPGKLARPLGDVAAFLTALEDLGPAPAARQRQRRVAPPVPVPAPTVKRRDLSPEAWGMVYGTDIPDRLRDGGAVNRHRVDLSIALHCVNSGWAEEEYVQLRLAAGTASQKALEIEEISGRGAAEAYLQGRYQAAVAWAATNTPFACREDVHEVLNEMERQLLSHSFGKAKIRDRDAGLAILAKARELGRLEVGYSCRELSQDLGGGMRRAAHALSSLVSAGFLAVAGRAEGKATRYLIKGFPISTQSVPVTRGAQNDCVVIGIADVELSHPVFERGALAPAGFHTLMAYDFDVPRTRAEARKQGNACSTSTHYKKTAELLDLGALRQLDDGSIVREQFDFDVMAKVTGAEERVAARRSRYALEQAQYADFLAVRLQRELDRLWTAAGGRGQTPLLAQSVDEALCRETGELLKRGEAEAWFLAEVQRRVLLQADRAPQGAVDGWGPNALRGGIIHEGPRGVAEDKAVEWVDHLGDRVCPMSELQRIIESEVA